MAIIQRGISTPFRLFALIFLVYFASSFFSASIREIRPLPGDLTLKYRKNYWVALTMPRILRGDEMHYLIMAHSLAHDGNLLLSREYTNVHLGGPEMGVYHARRAAGKFFQHFSRDQNFTLLANHPFGLSALQAMLLWPLAGSPLMESGAIWVTVFWGAMGAIVFLRVLQMLGISWAMARNTTLVMAFATPWWSYSRTLYTEVYIGTGMLIVMLAVLKNRTLWALPFIVAMGWFKYPALTLFFSAGTGDALWKRWRNFIIMGLSGAATLTCVYAFNRYYFANASWVTRTAEESVRRGIHSLSTAAAPIAWVPGKLFSNVERLFLDFDKGLFPHCPLLFIAVAGLIIMARQARRHFALLLVCALPWGLVHISYHFLMVGASYTTRYLVPLVPMACIGLPWYWQWSRNRPVWRKAGYLLVGLSFVNNAIAGIFPALTFDHKPWEVLAEFIRVLVSVLTPAKWN